MLKIMPLLAPLMLLEACIGDETISGYAGTQSVYELVEIDAAPFAARATIAFPTTGEVIGQAPCNRYFATQTAPYPWFALEGLGATRMACAELDAEIAFLEALSEMTLAEASGRTLILSNTDGRQMVFVAP